MPYYTRHGKIQTTISANKFKTIIQSMKNEKQEYKSFVVCLYYFGLRVSEVLSLTSDLFYVDEELLTIDVPKRLKHGKKTPPISVGLDKPFVKEIVTTLEKTKPNSRLWDFSRVTGWKVVVRAFDRYPHYFRLNRITQLFSPSKTRPSGYSVKEVKSWTGLTLQALDYYIGLASSERIAEGLE